MLSKPSIPEGEDSALWVEVIDSKTMEIKDQEGLFFIGEVVDVTGHLGGYNFQWAWASGYSAGLVA